MTEINIRDALPADAPGIARMNAALAAETEDRELDANLLQHGVAAVLRERALGRYWVAEDAAGQVIGQIMVTWEWSDWRNGVFWWIQSVYITPDRRRQGVFTALYRHVESLARAADNCCGLRLYFEKDNARAQATYRKLGMVDPGYRVMEQDFRQDKSQ